MSELDIEGSLILEKLAEIGKLDDFYDAIDSDDFERVRLLLRKANIDLETISIVLRKMESGDE
jgi:hypothetical protein